MAKSHLALVVPTAVIGTVEPAHRPPKRVRNAEVRAREYLTNAEVDGSSKPPGQSRRPSRRHHGAGRLPAPVELVTLRWDAIDFAHGQIHVIVRSCSDEALLP